MSGRPDGLGIDPEDARHILGYYGLPGGTEPGDFTKTLIWAIARADPGNRARLRMGFPSLVEAFENSEEVDLLQEIAGRDL